MHREWSMGLHPIGVCCHREHGEGSDCHLCTHFAFLITMRGQLCLGSVLRFSLHTEIRPHVSSWHLCPIQCKTANQCN